MNKIIGIPLFTIYLLIVILITIYVLNINKYNTSEIGNYTFIIDNNNLTIINKKNKININDIVYYYDIYSKNKNINKQKIIKKEILNNEETIINNFLNIYGF